MGTSTSRQSNYSLLLSHHPDNWYVISSGCTCQVLKNKGTHQLAQQYIIPIDNEQTYRQQLEVYEYRRRQQDNIVSILELQKLQTKHLCSNMIALKVLTERIPHRLSSVTILDYPEAMYIIRSALAGFRTIYHHDGSLQIDEDMIGFTQNGRVKVWLNSNFANNQRTFINRRFLKGKVGNLDESYQNQLNMIQSVFDLVIDKIPQGLDPLLKEKMSSINGFFNALNCVDDYCEEKNIIIPHCVSDNIYKAKPKTENKQGTLAGYNSVSNDHVDSDSRFQRRGTTQQKQLVFVQEKSQLGSQPLARQFSVLGQKVPSGDSKPNGFSGIPRIVRTDQKDPTSGLNFYFSNDNKRSTSMARSPSLQNRLM